MTCILHPDVFYGYSVALFVFLLFCPLSSICKKFFLWAYVEMLAFVFYPQNIALKSSEFATANTTDIHVLHKIVA